jgi:UDP-N-acetylglucosamine 2-epimerase (non-hydrolysing)
VRQVVFKLLDGIENLKLLEPIDFDTCLFLQSQVRLVITDSGGIQEEAPSFSVPTVVVRDATERTEGIEQGFAILAGVEADSIIQAAENYLMDEDIHLLLSNKSNPYGDGKAGKRIISGLLDQPEDAFLG